MTSTEDRCRICGSDAQHAFVAREMLYGTRERFRYFECPRCGCVQISEIPAALGSYYPSTYYSFHADVSPLRAGARRWALRGLFYGRQLMAPVRRVLARHFSRIALLALYDQASRGDRGASILDVGSGAGSLVQSLIDVGYPRVLGIDRFVEGDIVYRDRVVVRKLDISEVDERFDIISFNHSLEHMPDQVETLAHARRVLTRSGTAIVRVPVVDGDAWRTYRADWVQLDPPRHLYLHSRRSLELAAGAAGFRIASITYDSSELQYWGSELYRRDIPLNDPKVVAHGARAFFSSKQLAAYRQRARAANTAARGDQLVAFLEPRE